MSWAEVKKINSNLAKPLDEILNDSTSGLVAIKNAIDEPAKVYLTGKTTATPTTSSPLTLSINGAGGLHGIFMMLPVTTNTVKVTLKADGVSIMDYTLRATTSSSNVFIRMLVSTPELIVTYSVSPTCYFGMLMSEFTGGDLEMNYRSIGRFDVPIFRTVTETSLSGNRFSLINTSIKFKINFTAKVEAINGDCGNRATLFCIYTLD